METELDILLEYNKHDIKIMEAINKAHIQMIEIEMHYRLMEDRKNKINKLKQKL